VYVVQSVTPFFNNLDTHRKGQHLADPRLRGSNRMSNLNTEGLFLRGSYCPITKIHGFGHSEKDWWVIADVEWDDGTTSEKRELHPIQVSYDGDKGNTNHDVYSKSLMDYLLEHGEFSRKTGDWSSQCRCIIEGDGDV